MNILSCLDCLYNKFNVIVSSYLYLEFKYWEWKYKVIVFREINWIVYINLFVLGDFLKKLYVIIIVIILKKIFKCIFKFVIFGDGWIKILVF